MNIGNWFQFRGTVVSISEAVLILGPRDRFLEPVLPSLLSTLQYDLKVEVKNRVAEDPPYGLVYRKGEKNVALARDFAAFCIHSEVQGHFYDVRTRTS